MLSAIKIVLLGHLDPWRWDRLLSPNIRMELPLYTVYNPRREQVSKHVQFQCVFPSGECQMVKYVFCDIISKKTLCRRVNSHDRPGQGMGLAFPTQHLCSRSKSSFIPKNQQTWEFQLLIPHKQNPHTEINQLAETAKILPQPGIQLCVASVAVQSWAAWKTSLACSTFRSQLN